MAGVILLTTGNWLIGAAFVLVACANLIAHNMGALSKHVSRFRGRKLKRLMDSHPEILPMLVARIPANAPPQWHSEKWRLEGRLFQKAIKYKKQGYDFKLAY